MRLVAALLLTAAVCVAEDDLNLRYEIIAPGVPGPLCVYGKRAHVCQAGGVLWSFSAGPASAESPLRQPIKVCQ